MKKSKLLVLSLLAVSAMSLTSCGEAGPKGDTGDKGEQGEKGDTGTPGKDGTNGVDGKSFLNGEGVPSDTLGNDGDSYVDTTTFDYYAKENGKWVKKGNIKGEKGDTGAKGDAGEKGEKGDTGSKGDKGDTGSTGSQGSKGDTAWTNTILPFDYGYITTSTGSAKVGETVTFKVTITDDSCKAFNVLFDDDEVEAFDISRTSADSDKKEFEIKKEMKANGYVVRAVGYDNLGAGLSSSSNISLAKDLTSSDLGFSSTASLFDGSIAAFSDDLTTFGTGELEVSKDINLNLNGYDINLGTNKIVVDNSYKFNVGNKDQVNPDEVAEITSSGETVIEVTGGTKTLEADSTSLIVGKNVGISGTTAIKQSGANSSVTIDGGTVSGTTSGIEVSGGSLTISSGTVKGKGAYSAEGNGSAIVINNDGSSSNISVDIAGGEVSSDNSYAVYQKTATGVSETISITYNSGDVSGSQDIANSNATITYDVKSKDFEYNESTKTYTINSKQGLIDFRTLVNAGNAFEGKIVKLAKNIDFGEDNWSPIGYGIRDGKSYKAGAKVFKGTFDGNNKTITYSFTSSVSGDGCLGLFAIVDGGTIQDLNLKVTIEAGSIENLGAAVGLAVNNSQIKNVKTLSGSTIKGYKGLGGIVGRMTVQGSITDCENNASISTADGKTGSNSGGIVGAAYYTEVGKEMYITNCVNNGVVTCQGTSLGGIVGLSAANVNKCKNTASVTNTGVGTSLGGIVGWQKMHGTISDCNNSGAVTGENMGYGTGGIVGWVVYNDNTANYANYSMIVVTGNTNSGNISGNSDAGGIIGILYNAGVITNNKNSATSIISKVQNFSAGIVGGYQNTEKTNVGYEVGKVYVTFKGNTTCEFVKNSSGEKSTLLIYDNSGQITIEE